MGSIETFDHTADVGFRIKAESLDDLFSTSASGLFGYIVVNLSDVKSTESESIDLLGENPAELLAAWLNELIFRSETRHRLYSGFSVRLAGEGSRLTGTISGETIDRDKHILDHEVKAVTHHGLTIDRDGSTWIAEFILDI